VEVVASLSQGRTAAAQCGLFTHKSVPDIFEPPCILRHFDKHSWKLWTWWKLLPLCFISHTLSQFRCSGNSNSWQKCYRSVRDFTWSIREQWDLFQQRNNL